MKRAFLFPGQGALGKRLSDDSQVATFSASLTSFQSLVETGTYPNMVAGLSLGEFSALVAAGIIDSATGLELVGLRQSLMEEAARKSPGSMVVILGLDERETVKICDSITCGIVRIANYNCPGQLVISGETSAVYTAVELVRKRGAKTITLPVSGAFHSPLMASANAEFVKHLKRVDFSSPKIPFYSSVSGRQVQATSEIRALLFRQMTSPVLWEQTVRSMLFDGASEFVEMEPSRVLSSLVRRIQALP